MTIGFAGLTIVLLVAAFLVLVRALRGPTVFDRVLAVNMFGTKTVLLLSILGSVNGRAGFLDVALLYALINYIATIAILKYVEASKPTESSEGGSNA